jgi:predicted deacylase
MGIKDRDRRWLARLVTTRRLVIVPTANALGYDRNQREEEDVDVNRDFPFDVLDSRDCMRSVAARTLNELFRDDQFQMAVTFHAGMEMIGFQWGAESYMNDPVSPDDQGQYEVARAMSQFSGSFPGTPVYPYGISNMVVYPVRGGMEDWAYAGSWDKPRSKYSYVRQIQ